jgi:hypothetical protein
LPTLFKGIFMNKYVTSALAVAALGLSLGSANAAVTLLSNIAGATGGGNYGGLGAGAVVETFSASAGTATDVPGAMISGSYGIYTADSPGQFLKPLGTTTGFLSVPVAGVPAPQSATYQFGSSYSLFGFYLGSPDTGNSITFLLNGAEVGGAGNGTYSFSSAPFATSNNAQSTYLTFNAGGLFNQVKFSTGVVALEADNFAVSAIPEPGEWAMMVAGLGVVSLIARRRKAKA